MREVSPEEIERHIDVATLIPAMREALQAEVQGDIEVPLRAFWGLKDNFGILAMPARSQSLKRAIFKFLTLVDSNRAFGLPGVMGELTLLDGETGAAVARLPAENVTLLRTAACSAVATDLLAHSGADTLALFGSGPQAAHHAEAMLAVRPIRRVMIQGRNRGRAAKLAADLTERLGVSAIIGPDRGFLREAMIVCTATNATEVLFESGDIHPQAHINGVGAYRPEMKELPAQLLREATIFVDSVVPVAREAGDLLAAFGNLDEVMKRVRAIGELLAKPLPERPKGRTVYKSVGNAGQDLYASAAILEKLPALK
ncbi:MAG TPA: ornithine cyclodeaminase family protein [Rhizomicrobium sp.]|nr:ornithine cyclodeaminase family protein [Rhizomicrobium sp.]